MIRTVKAEATVQMLNVDPVSCPQQPEDRCRCRRVQVPLLIESFKLYTAYLDPSFTHSIIIVSYIVLPLVVGNPSLVLHFSCHLCNIYLHMHVYLAGFLGQFMVCLKDIAGSELS